MIDGGQYSSTDQGSGYLSTFVSSLLVLIAGGFSGVLVARFLGPAGRGELAILQYYPSILGSVFCLAMPTALTYFVAREPDRTSQISGAGLKLSIGFALVGSLLFGFLAPRTLGPANSHLASSVSLVCFASAGLVLSPNLQALHWGLARYNWCNLVRIASAVSYPAILAILWFTGRATPILFAICGLSVQLIVAIFQYLKFGENLLRVKVSMDTYKLVFGKSLEYFVPVSVFILFDLTDKFILIHSAGLQEIGWYAVSYALTSPILAVADSLSQVGFVGISEAHHDQEVGQRLLREFKWMQITILAIVIGDAVLIAPEIVVLFGNAFLRSLPIAFLLLLSMGIYATNRTLLLFFRAHGMALQSTVSCGLAWLTLVAFGFWACRTRGLEAFVVVLLCANLISLGSHVFLLRRKLGCRMGDLWGLDRAALVEWWHATSGIAATATLRLRNRRIGSRAQELLKKVMPRGLIRILSLQFLGYEDGVAIGRFVQDGFRSIERELDTAALDSLRRRVSQTSLQEPASPAKYPDYRFWLRLNLRKAAIVGVSEGRVRRVLDLGSGPGYFLRVCRHFGVDALGLELPDEDLTPMEREIFNETTRILGVQRKRLAVEAFKPLELNGSFDLVVGFLVCFNNHKRNNEWGVEEWSFFLEDVRKHLRHDGRIVLELNENAERYGELRFYDEATLAYFKSVGNVHSGWIWIGQP